jgi:hypothetical protein
MIVYCVPTLDLWSGWQKSEDVFKLRVFDDGTAHDASRCGAKFKDLAVKVGWEGDIREGPFVAVLPDEGGVLSPVIIAWKQDNNGTTFVASRYLLPWYDSDFESVDHGKAQLWK